MKTKDVFTLVTAKKVLFKDVYGNKVILVLKKFCGKKSLRLYFPGLFSGCNHRKKELDIRNPPGYIQYADAYKKSPFYENV